MSTKKPLSKRRATVVIDDLPSDNDLLQMPLSIYKEFQCSHPQSVKYRQKRVYPLNKNNARWLWRCFWNNGTLRILKIDKWD